MKSYEVSVTDRAAQQLENAASWIAADNPQAAEAWFNQAIRKIKSLSKAPQRCGVARESRDVPFEVRELLLGRKRSWRVLFTVRDDLVVVMSVRHCSRVDATPDELTG